MSSLLVSLMVFLSVSWTDPSDHFHHDKLLIAHTAKDSSIVGMCQDFGDEVQDELLAVGAVRRGTKVTTVCLVEAES